MYTPRAERPSSAVPSSVPVGKIVAPPPGGAAAPGEDAEAAAERDLLLKQGYRRTDRMLGKLLAAHLLLIFALAPLRDTWTEAVVWGGGLVLLGVAMAWLRPGALLTRLTMATCLLGVSALIIHQTGGMIEMHFHIFAILAFLLTYRDWRVPVWGAAVTAGHHVLFNHLQTHGSGLRIFAEHDGWGIVAVHAGWVVFEVAILVSMARSLAAETRQAETLVRVAEHMGRGDLSVRATGAVGAVGDAVAAVNRGSKLLADSVRMVRVRSHEVSEVAGTLSAAADHVTQAADGVADSLTRVASGAQEQARATAGMATTLGDLVLSVEGVSDRAAGVSAATEHAVGVARSGSQVIQRAVESMGRIRETVLLAAREIEEMRTRSDQISRINQVITEMADQTNLLALNAAIEAARAGEQGRGFAVVADEVRILANRSGEAAKEAAELIAGMQGATARAVQSMAQGTTGVEEGSALAGNAGSALREIVTVVEQTMADVGAISRAAGEIAGRSRTALREAGLDSAAGGAELAEIVLASQSNAAAAEEAAAAVEEINASMQQMSASAEELAGIARDLMGEVSRFQIPDEAPAAA